MRFVVDRERGRIEKYRGSLLEGDVVLAHIRNGFGGIPVKVIRELCFLGH